MSIATEVWSTMSPIAKERALEKIAKEEERKRKEKEKDETEVAAYLDIVVGGNPPKGDSPEGCGGTGPAAPDGGHPAACAPIGLLGLSPALVTRVAKWSRKSQQALVDLCTDYREVKSDPGGLAEQTCSGEQPLPWDAWDNFIDATEEQRSD